MLGPPGCSVCAASCFFEHGAGWCCCVCGKPSDMNLMGEAEVVAADAVVEQAERDGRAHPRWLEIKRVRQSRP